jgi:uncharacterized membrane protein
MSGADLPSLAEVPDYCVVSRRNNSLGTRQRWTLFVMLAGVSFGLALAFAAAGAWLVLPYSALEIALLAAAFVFIERRAGDWERLTVTGDRVLVERSINGRRMRHEWNRPWLVVTVDGDGVVRIGSEAVEFGGALPAQERIAVARALRRLASTHQRGPDGQTIRT